MSLAALRDVLLANWNGFETLCTEVSSRFPKFGNNIDEVDRYAIRMGETFCRVVKAQSPILESHGITRMLIPTFYSLDQATAMGG